MRRAGVVGLILGAGLFAWSGSVASMVPLPRRCSLVGGIPVDGFDPVPLVKSASVILRGRADSVSAPAVTADRILTLWPKTLVYFSVLEVIDSGGGAIPSTVAIHGTLSDKPDFNTGSVPYRWVRSGGMGGTCNAFAYQKGGEFLLLLKRGSADSLMPYWSALTPTNEQVRGATDPWVVWVRSTRGAGRK